MANYEEMVRSNYFRVKDVQAFKAFIEQFDSIELIQRDEAEADGLLFGFYTYNGLPTYVYDEATEEEREVQFTDELAAHLADDEVLIVVCVGWEKVRYFVGIAEAINNKGERHVVNLDSIYALAKQLTSKPEQVTYAEY